MASVRKCTELRSALSKRNLMERQEIACIARNQAKHRLMGAPVACLDGRRILVMGNAACFLEDWSNFCEGYKWRNPFCNDLRSTQKGQNKAICISQSSFSLLSRPQFSPILARNMTRTS